MNYDLSIVARLAADRQYAFRSSAAARHAFLDQGVRIPGEDRCTGTISGTKSGINLSGRWRSGTCCAT